MPSTATPALARSLTSRMHRGMGRDGAAAQVVAIGEAAGHDDEIDLGQLAVPVPDHLGRLAHGMPKGGGDIMLAIGAGEDDDGGVHGP